MTDLTDPTPDLRARILAAYADPSLPLTDDDRVAKVRTIDSLPDDFFALASAAATDSTFEAELAAFGRLLDVVNVVARGRSRRRAEAGRGPETEAEIWDVMLTGWPVLDDDPSL
jgi:hypothetical protein